LCDEVGGTQYRSVPSRRFFERVLETGILSWNNWFRERVSE